MSKYFVIALVALSSLASKSVAQVATNTEAADSTNIYWQALKIYVGDLNNKTTTLLIEKDDLTTDRLPAKIGNCNLMYLDNTGVQKYLKEKNQIQLIRIVPVRVKKGDFFVSIIPFTVKEEKRNINYINSGGDNVIFTFDSSAKTFMFKELFHGGI